jgi:hypothetical protein
VAGCSETAASVSTPTLIVLSFLLGIAGMLALIAMGVVHP